MGEYLEKLSMKELLATSFLSLIIGVLFGLSLGQCGAKSSGFMVGKEEVLFTLFYILVALIISEITLLFLNHRKIVRIIYLIKIFLIGAIISILIFGEEVLCIL
ncbi:hypothetical protein J7L49_06665 [Candidatus Bathyarchaeota archaeon]|nr:hypothetical protein [Candidatus Bathyarchaeota archaeon]